MMKSLTFATALLAALTHGQVTEFQASFNNQSEFYPGRNFTGVVRFLNTKPNMTIVFDFQAGFGNLLDDDTYLYRIVEQPVNSADGCNEVLPAFNPYEKDLPAEVNTFGSAPVSSFDQFPVGSLSGLFPLTFLLI